MIGLPIQKSHVTLGTPPSKLSLEVDTGSSDMWVNVPMSKYCLKNDCSLPGTSVPKASTTNKLVNHDFAVTYTDQTGASGDFVTDTLHFEGAELKDMQFGLGPKSPTMDCIIDIGYQRNEASGRSIGDQPYPNLPQLLHDQGMINTNAYSLWLNKNRSRTPSSTSTGLPWRLPDSTRICPLAIKPHHSPGW